MIPLKSEEDLKMMRISGKVLSRVMQRLLKTVRAGVSTSEIDSAAADLIHKEGVQPAFKGYKGFPAATCVSVNDEIVHGVPSERKIEEGDIVSLDVGINYEGYFSDLALTLGVGKISARAKKLIEVTRESLYEGIKRASPKSHLYDISYAVQAHVENNGFSVVREFVGHGIGRSLHEEPEIPNFGRPHQGPMLKSGMVLAIEPMVNMGTWETRISENGWTALTKDGLPSAHFEHTVAVTDKGPEILTN